MDAEQQRYPGDQGKSPKEMSDTEIVTSALESTSISFVERLRVVIVERALFDEFNIALQEQAVAVDQRLQALYEAESQVARSFLETQLAVNEVFDELFDGITQNTAATD